MRWAQTKNLFHVKWENISSWLCSSSSWFVAALLSCYFNYPNYFFSAIISYFDKDKFYWSGFSILNGNSQVLVFCWLLPLLWKVMLPHLKSISQIIPNISQKTSFNNNWRTTTKTDFTMQEKYSKKNISYSS